MLGRIYKKSITNVLHFFNYNKIENEKGSSHVVVNVIDLALAFTYSFISIWKLKEVTTLVLIINFLTLLRLIVSNIKNSINLRDKYEKKYLKRPGLLFKSAYDYKIIIELCVIAFSLTPFWVQGIVFEEHLVRGFAGIIIILGFLENLINILVELFKASIDISNLKVSG